MGSGGDLPIDIKIPNLQLNLNFNNNNGKADVSIDNNLVTTVELSTNTGYSNSAVVKAA